MKNQKLTHQDKRELGFNLLGLFAKFLIGWLGNRWDLSEADTVQYAFNKKEFQVASKQSSQFFLDTKEEKRGFIEKLVTFFLRLILSYIGKKEEKKIEKNNLALKGARGLFENSK